MFAAARHGFGHHHVEAGVFAAAFLDERNFLAAAFDLRDAQRRNQRELDHAIALADGFELDLCRRCEQPVAGDTGVDLVLERLRYALFLARTGAVSGQFGLQMFEAPDALLLGFGVEIDHCDFLGRGQHGERAARLHVKAQAGGMLAVHVDAEEARLRRVVKVGEKIGLDVIDAFGGQDRLP